MAEGNWIKLYRKMVDDPIFVNSTGPQVKVLLTVMFLGQQGKVAVERRCAEHRRKTCEEFYRKAMRQFGIYRRGKSARESKAQIQPEKRNRLYANENGQVRKADS